MREVTAVVDEYGFLEVTSENLIGYVDDENSTLVEVDVSAWAATLPEGVKYSIIVLHPVGSAWPVLSLATPVSGKISFLVVRDSTTLSGTAKMAVLAIASEFQSSTNAVRLRVAGSIAVGEAPTGNPAWITALLAAAINANDVASAVAAAEVLRAEVESGRVSAEDVRVAAELLRVQNEEARVLSEATRAEFYDGFASQLDLKADQAGVNSIQGQVNELVLGAVEVVQARTNSTGTTFETLGYRLNDSDLRLGGRTAGSVSVAEYGAVGDGLTDDTSAIQSAINSSAKIVLFERGKTYRVGMLTMPSDKELDGNGACLKLKVNSYTPIITNGSYVNGANVNLVVRNFELDGSAKDHTVTTVQSDYTGLNYAMNCIRFEGAEGVKIENVRAHHAWGINIYPRECTDVEIVNCEAYASERHSGIVAKTETHYTYVRIESCNCHHNNLDGIEMYQNTTIVNCRCNDNGLCAYSGDLPAAGIYAGSDYTDNCTVSMNECARNSGIGIELNESERNTVLGNDCHHNGLSGILAQKTKYSNILGNRCYDNHQTTNPQYVNDGNNSGIFIGTWESGSLPTYNTVIGNVCFDDQATKTQIYGIQAINCDYNTVIGNNTQGNLTSRMLKNQNAHSVFLEQLSDLLNTSTSYNIQGITLSGGALNLFSATALYVPTAGTPNAGCLRFNATSHKFEGYNGTAWAELG